MRALVAGSCVLTALVLVPAGSATDATAAELRRLADGAATDSAARAELERIDSVEGRAVDLSAALADAEGRELAARLELLGEAPRGGVVDTRDARAAARDILSDERFRGSDVPRPFRGLLAWIGDRLEPIGKAIGSFAERVPGGPAVLWTIVGGAVALVAALVALRMAHGRAARVVEARARLRTSRVDPLELEREADEAERRGDLERALRLRFRAGLVRLDRARVIELRASSTTGELRRALRSRDFDAAARTFDEIVYGRRRPVAGDVEDSRSSWARVLEEARAR
jgi:hypothetical protein